MRDRPLRLAALVLAAGAGSRYSREPGAKLLASLQGGPLLASVLRAVREYGPATTVVVLGRAAEAIERDIDWAGELRVTNHDPERGLASSLQVGIDTLRALSDHVDGAFIVLGDQPWLRPGVMQALAEAAGRAGPGDRAAIVPRYEDTAPHQGAVPRDDRPVIAPYQGALPRDDRPAIAPRHKESPPRHPSADQRDEGPGARSEVDGPRDPSPGARNPVLLLRPAWRWVDELTGDRGLASLIASRPDAVLEVPVAGTMPDVDTPADLERLEQDANRDAS